MAQEQRGEGVGSDPIELGRSYGEVGPALGRLYEARHVATGRVALRFMLSESVQWRPEGEWRVRLSFGPHSPSVTAVVERAPASARVTELTDAFVQMTAALTRSEDSAPLQEHFSRGPVRPWNRWAIHALGGLILLSLGLRVWLYAPREPGRAAETRAGVEAWPIDGLQVDPAPSKPGEGPRPVKNQKHAPCTQGLEFEISGVCWLHIALDQGYCPTKTIAHDGNCLLPVATPKPVPSSLDAGAPTPR